MHSITAGGAHRAIGWGRGNTEHRQHWGETGDRGKWDTGIQDGSAQRTRGTHSLCLGDAYPMGFSLCSSHMVNTASKQRMLKLAACSHGAAEMWQCWVKWRYQLQQWCEQGGDWGSPCQQVIFLGSTQPVLLCLSALLHSLYSSSFLGINVILALAKLP